MKEYWQKKKAQPSEQLKASIQQQVVRYSKRASAGKRLQDATRAKNSWNYQEAKRVKKELFDRLAEGEQFAVDLKIEQFFKVKPQGEA